MILTNDVDHLSEEEIAALEDAFPHQDDLTDDQYDVWKRNAYLLYPYITDREDA